MWSQTSIFDVGECPADIPVPDENGCITADQLTPIRWEAWKFSNSDWTLFGGKPYVTDAVLVILPGNRLYVKEWMLYPFMYELASAEEVEKQYYSLRKKIVERMKNNNETQKTWQVDALPQLSDMYLCNTGTYSCLEYAKRNH